VLAVIPRQIETSNARVEPRELSDLLPAVVGASVVDEDELILEPPRAERLRDAFRKQSERRTAVVDGDDDGDFRGQRSAPVSFRSRTDGLYAVLDELIFFALSRCTRAPPARWCSSPEAAVASSGESKDESRRRPPGGYGDEDRRV
jgi:hypothetical protein